VHAQDFLSIKCGSILSVAKLSGPQEPEIKFDPLDSPIEATTVGAVPLALAGLIDLHHKHYRASFVLELKEDLAVLLTN